ncbi:hypothetical protein B0J14DRAFT_606920 [Halenospora varia]|nr:hypothetical protein B0J14DRAFT_606920 [Halenospora varia]
MASNTKHIVILGAGVTGLQTAISFLTSPETQKYKITIVAEHMPGDLAAEYTSPWAGGHWRSHATLAPEDKLPREFDERTYRSWIKILTEGDNLAPQNETPSERTKRIGLGFSPALDFWGSETPETARDGSGLWWTKPGLIRDLKLLNQDELQAENAPKTSKAVFGVSYESININVPQYLVYLLNRATALGATLLKRKVNTSTGLPGVIQNLKSLINTPVFAVINCSGLAARHFVEKDEAEKLYPIRGQTILVKGEAARTVTLIHNPSTPPPKSSTLFLVPAPAPPFSAAGGPRVEVEGRVEGAWVVHSYGHAGAGYQNSVGCAEKVVGLVGELEEKGERARL